MQNLINNHAQLATTILLLISIASVWFYNSWTKILFVIFIAVGASTGILMPASFISIIGLALLIYFLYNVELAKPFRLIILLAILLLALALGLHLVPGFNNWQVYDTVNLSQHSAPFSIWYYYDKPLIGLFIIMAIAETLNRTTTDWKAMFSSIWKIAVVGTLIVYLLSYALGYARFDLSFTPVFIPWAMKNLFLVVIAEEAFFRGLIQGQLQHYIKHDKAGIIAVFVAGVLFGIAHFAGGPLYTFLACIAGILYGYVYYITKRIEAAILTHFLLNVGHFLFFTYPYYQQ